MDSQPDIALSRGALLVTRIAAAASVLVLSVAPAFLLWSFIRHLARLDDLFLIPPLCLVAAPHMLLLLRLRAGPADWPQRATSALAWAVPWSLFVGLAASFLIALLTRADSTPGIFLPVATGLLGIVMIAATTIAISGVLMNRSIPGTHAGRSLWFVGFAKAAVWAVLTSAVFIVTLPPIEPPNRIAANEALAVGSLRSISAAQLEYQSRYPDKGFARTLADLGPPPGASLIDGSLASGRRLGYLFELIPGSPDGLGRTATFTSIARPIDLGVTGKRFFFVDESQVIRWTELNRTATIDDLPLR